MPTEHALLLTSIYDSGDIAHEILEIAGVTHPKLVEDVVEALSVTPDWVPRDWERGSPDEQLTYSWEAFKKLVKHETRYIAIFYGPDFCADQGNRNRIHTTQLGQANSQSQPCDDCGTLTSRSIG